MRSPQPTETSPSPAEPGELERSTKLVIALLSAVVFMAVVNGTMINVALPYIGRDFAVSEGTYGWVVTGYALTFGIFNAIDGRLADVLGTRRLYLSGILVLGISSLVLAFSPSIGFAIGGRIIQGAGAAALPVLGTAIVSRLVPARRRGAAMGIILSVVGVAASIGPFLGGFLVQVGGWRSVFAFTGLSLLAFPFGLRLLPKELDETHGRFDLIGATLLGAGVATLMYGFTIVEDQGFGWPLYACLGAGFALLAAFAAWIRFADQPFVRPRLFRSLRYLATCTIAALTNATRFGTVVLVPIFLTEINGLEPVWIGAVLLPGAIFIAILSPKTGDLADRIGPRLPVGLGCAGILVGNLVTAYYAGGSPWGVAAGMGLYGLGFAFTQSPLVSTTSKIVPREMTGVGLGLFMMIFFVGGAAGVAASVTTVELQAAGATSWLGFDLGPGAVYSNAVLMLTALAVLGLALVPLLPEKGALGEV